MSYIKNKLDEFDKLYVDENLWKSDDNSTAFVPIEFIKNFIEQALTDYHNHIVEMIEEEKMNLELLRGAKMNGNFKRLDMKESIGWNKALSNIIEILSLLQGTNPKE